MPRTWSHHDGIGATPPFRYPPVLPIIPAIKADIALTDGLAQQAFSIAVLGNGLLYPRLRFIPDR
jgi:hypothetical protein